MLSQIHQNGMLSTRAEIYIGDIWIVSLEIPSVLWRNIEFDAHMHAVYLRKLLCGVGAVFRVVTWVESSESALQSGRWVVVAGSALVFEGRKWTITTVRVYGHRRTLTHAHTRSLIMVIAVLSPVHSHTRTHLMSSHSCYHKYYRTSELHTSKLTNISISVPFIGCGPPYIGAVDKL